MSDSENTDAAIALGQDIAQLLREQEERATRLRHVQEFLTTPAFLDLAEMAVEVSDDDDTLQDRKRDLDYKIEMMRSILALMEEERALLDRVRTSNAPPRDEADAGGDQDD
ncbi:hypothetical protein [Roseivivax sp. CAU 1753]